MARTIGGAHGARQSLFGVRTRRGILGRCLVDWPSMSFLADLSAADARLGGKARSLAQLAEQGFATPPGFALTGELFRALCPGVPVFDHLDQAALATLDEPARRLMRAPWPAGFRDELHARLGAIGAASFGRAFVLRQRGSAWPARGGRLRVVRKCALADVEGAIRRVLCSALAPGAVAYAMAHGQQAARDPVAVLVHAFLTGQAEGSAAFAPARMAKPLVTHRRGQLPAEAEASLVRTLVALAAARGPLEIEWVFAEGRVVYLQARPFEAPAPACRGPVSTSSLAEPPRAPRGAGTWPTIPCRSRQPRPGWLSWWMRGAPSAFASACWAATCSTRVTKARFRRTIAAESARSSLLPCVRRSNPASLAWGKQPDLEAALALFVFAYEPIFGVLQPALRLAHDRICTPFLNPMRKLRSPCCPRCAPVCLPWPASGARAAKIPSAGATG
jgi:hypothetical protein